MPKKSLSPNKEATEEPEQRSSPSHSEPNDRPTVQERRRFIFREGCVLAAKLAEKLEEVQKIPIKRGARIVSLVAKFNDFP